MIRLKRPKRLRVSDTSECRRVELLEQFDSLHAGLDEIEEFVDSLPYEMQPRAREAIRLAIGVGGGLREAEYVQEKRPVVSVRRQNIQGELRRYLDAERFLDAEITGVRRHVERACDQLSVTA